MTVCTDINNCIINLMKTNKEQFENKAYCENYTMASYFLTVKFQLKFMI